MMSKWEQQASGMCTLWGPSLRLFCHFCFEAAPSSTSIEIRNWRRCFIELQHSRPRQKQGGSKGMREGTANEEPALTRLSLGVRARGRGCSAAMDLMDYDCTGARGAVVELEGDIPSWIWVRGYIHTQGPLFRSSSRFRNSDIRDVSTETTMSPLVTVQLSVPDRTRV